MTNEMNGSVKGSGTARPVRSVWYENLGQMIQIFDWSDSRGFADLEGTHTQLGRSDLILCFSKLQKGETYQLKKKVGERK